MIQEFESSENFEAIMGIDDDLVLSPVGFDATRRVDCGIRFFLVFLKTK